MKAGIITHYGVHNHGAQLQLYALRSQLIKMGYDAKALTYKKNYDFMEQGIEAKYSFTIRSIPVYVKYLLKNGLRRTLYNFKKKRILKAFRKNCDLEGQYYSRTTDLDVVVIGSDEIFSLEPGLNPCFWGMGVPCENIVSYAASFGPTTLSFIKDHGAEEFVEAGIKRIKCISVRDKNSFDIVNQYTQKNVFLVCDPVLLYDFSDEILANNVPKSKKKKYCIVYSYDANMNDKETQQAIKQYARKRGLKIYSVGYFHKWCDKNIHAQPLELFEWFQNAEMVFTDTFHGSVLSIVNETPFFAKVSGNQNKLAFLLEQYGLHDRLITSFNEVENKSESKIDIAKLNARKQDIKNYSINYLKNALEICGE